MRCFVFLFLLAGCQVLWAERPDPYPVTFGAVAGADWNEAVSGEDCFSLRLGLRPAPRLTAAAAPVEILIQNIGEEDAPVNGAHPARMFAIFLTADGRPVPLRREFLAAERHAEALLSGWELPGRATRHFPVDLARWFAIPGPGRYELRVCHRPVRGLTAEALTPKEWQMLSTVRQFDPEQRCWWSLSHALAITVAPGR